MAEPARTDATPLLRWTVSFLRPYRGRVSLLAVLLGSEIVLGALAPWPLAVVIDNVLGGRPFEGGVTPWASVNGFLSQTKAVLTHNNQFAFLVLVVVAGVFMSPCASTQSNPISPPFAAA